MSEATMQQDDSKTNATNDYRRAAIYKCVIDELAEQQDQLHAIATALLSRIEPKEPENALTEDCDMVAWRLAQVLTDMLSSTKLLTGSRARLMDGLKHT